MAILICPTCNKQFDSATSPAMPFCGHRCKSIDLNRWLTEEIALPVDELPDEPLDLPPSKPREPGNN